MAAALIVGLATPLLRFLTSWMNALIGLTWDSLGAPIGFLVLVSFAICVLTGSLSLLPIGLVWNPAFAGAGLVLVYAGVRALNATTTWSEFLQWPILKSMLALSIASWIIWR